MRVGPMSFLEDDLDEEDWFTYVFEVGEFRDQRRIDRTRKNDREEI